MYQSSDHHPNNVTIHNITDLTKDQGHNIQLTQGRNP
jgi:hypothetical protein